MTQALIETINNVKKELDIKAFEVIKDYYCFHTDCSGLIIEFQENMLSYIQKNFPCLKFSFNLNCDNNTLLYKIKYNKDADFGFQTCFDLSLFERMK